jgi:alkylation response protein AidB-like acyl-CoA dehydrogenase
MGLLGVTVPEKWGGLGLGYLEHTIAMEGEPSINRLLGMPAGWRTTADRVELSRASASVALSYGVRFPVHADAWLKPEGTLEPHGQPTHALGQ